MHMADCQLLPLCSLAPSEVQWVTSHWLILTMALTFKESKSLVFTVRMTHANISIRDSSYSLRFSFMWFACSSYSWFSWTLLLQLLESHIQKSINMLRPTTIGKGSLWFTKKRFTLVKKTSTTKNIFQIFLSSGRRNRITSMSTIGRVISRSSRTSWKTRPPKAGRWSASKPGSQANISWTQSNCLRTRYLTSTRIYKRCLQKSQRSIWSKQIKHIQSTKCQWLRPMSKLLMLRAWARSIEHLSEKKKEIGQLQTGAIA